MVHTILSCRAPRQHEAHPVCIVACFFAFSVILSTVAVIEKYISSLQDSIKSKDAEIKKLKGDKDNDEEEDDDDAAMKQEEEEEEEEEDVNDEPEFPPLYDASTGAEDFEKAGDLKQAAADLQADGDWQGALEKYNAAVMVAPPSALLYANRAKALLKLGRPRAAERDCDLALAENPDSAKVRSTMRCSAFFVAFVVLFLFILQEPTHILNTFTTIHLLFYSNLS
jgi:tetratricopeptide (TPR) repeat protein